MTDRKRIVKDTPALIEQNAHLLPQGESANPCGYCNGSGIIEGDGNQPCIACPHCEDGTELPQHSSKS